jgi:phospholipase C
MTKNPVIFGCLTAVYAVSAAATLAYGADPAANFKTKTPIKHLVVIFQENVSFDHYFGTYPLASNSDGTTFFPAAGTYIVNNLLTPLDPSNGFMLTPQNLLILNPNNVSANPSGPAAGLCANAPNGMGAANPFRLSHSQAVTADQGHNYDPEQGAYDGGQMDGFPACVGVKGPPPSPNAYPFNTTGLTMGYYDGNTVTALWNYAQFYAMNDNHYSTVFGPSTPGALNVVAGQSNGVSATLNVFSTTTPITLLHPTHEAWGDDAKIQKNISVIGDGDPLTDVCSNASIDQVTVASKNIGDLLTAKNITWGAFMGGFNLSLKNPNGTTGCSRSSAPVANPTAFTPDYIAHHAWFQYFVSTRNPNHARPRSNAAIGTGYYGGMVPEPANHNYDLQDFYNILNGKLIGANLPAVSYLKAPAYQDGHAGYSNPLDEQTFLVNTINALQNSQYWKNTAVVIMYDDSDGWYDHQMPPIVNPSFNNTIISGTRVDILNGGGLCNYSGTGATGNGNQQGTGPTPMFPLNGTYAARMNGRCGYGTRMPFLLISPFAAQNAIDHTLTDQSSIIRFIEDNWLNGQRLQSGASFDTIAGPIDNMFDFTRNDGGRLVLDPTTGAVVP